MKHSINMGGSSDATSVIEAGGIKTVALAECEKQ